MKSISIAVLFCVAVLTSCTKDKITQPKVLPAITQKHQQAVALSNNFGIDLYQEIKNEEAADKNIIISPLSANMALSMLLNGAKDGTEDAILNTLRINTDVTANNQTCRDLMDFLPNVDPAVTLGIANSIWYRSGFSVLNSFLDVNQSNFDAQISTLNFSAPNAKNIINSWVENATNKKIKELIDEVSADHVMFLINATYFNAPWKTTFDKSETQNMLFQLTNGNSIQVPMMFSNKIEMDYFTDSNIEMVGLPYGKGNYNFYAILPKTNNDLAQLENNFTTAEWHNWINNAQKVKNYGLYMPKFELDYEITMNKALTAMGMGVAFSNDANFTGISDAEKLMVSKVKQKTYIKVDEEGTEAAAATSVEVVFTSLPPTVSFNRPFMFVISEKTTGAILFMGRIMKPIK
ncbi:MAG TPA: serpin family protein [Chitinophagales bacterium]|nr:serpin family protein [Chitinophagales bacterium]